VTASSASIVLSAALAMLALSGCSSPSPPEDATATQSVALDRDAVAEVGDVTVRASATQTSQLPAAVARDYGITERRPDTLLLLVTVRRGAAGEALPANVVATVTDLRGGRQDIAMRQVRSDAYIDSVGTTSTSLPDTLRFDLTVNVDGMAPVRLQLQREVFPQ
jgi:hypothetical protein